MKHRRRYAHPLRGTAGSISAGNGLAKSLGTLALLCTSLLAQAASFDCAKAATFVEKEICTNAVLSRLDDALGDNYRLMKASDIGADAQAEQKARQKAWLGRRNSCTEYACIESAYRTRIDEICEVPVLTGPHPACTLSASIESW
jgi:uncharacterized protein